ncbi:hypothetical protein V2J09_000667 [Rumex salicifolius]
MAPNNDERSKDSTIDSNNRLFLHHSDHPNYVLSTELLNDNNYYQWKRSVEVSLNAKNKLSFVNGTYRKPTADPSKIARWDRCNSMVIAWLQHLVEKDISETLLYFDTAAQIWEKLKMRFGSPNCTRFLVGLNEAYAVVRGNVLMMKPTPSLAEVYHLVLQDEKQRELKSTYGVGRDSTALNSH